MADNSVSIIIESLRRLYKQKDINIVAIKALYENKKITDCEYQYIVRKEE